MYIRCKTVLALALASALAVFAKDEAAVLTSVDDPLKISEICPRPDARDPDGKKSGWVELWNSGTSDVDLADYSLVRANRGKVLKPKEGRLESRIVRPGEYALVYLKINPRKFPLVALYKGKTLLESFVVPVDLPDGHSFAPAGGVFGDYAGVMTTPQFQVADPKSVTRVILPHATPGKKNDRTDETAYGPNAGPLYGVKHDRSDWEPQPCARLEQDYPISLAINPLSAAAGDAIVSVRLVYRFDFRETNVVTMTKGAFDAAQGQLWTASVPGDRMTRRAFNFQEPGGRLLRWAALVTDRAGNVWRTPSFRNPEDGYEWYGTITEPSADQISSTLPTWHIFTSRENGGEHFNKQYSAVKKQCPLGCRVGIFDSQTSNYYDNVRADLRGNTTAFFGLNKYSHGLRFSKVHPMRCTDPFSGETIEVRKTSLLAEVQDPANLRSDLSMYLRRLAGQPVPFGYPVRLQKDGAFFQLAHHTNRFTDEYLTDYFHFDKDGCCFKNVGTVGGVRDTGGGASQVLPDDGTDAMPEYKAFAAALSGLGDYHAVQPGPSAARTNEVQKNVVRLYDLPAWFNFLALSRITQECDDDTSTLNVYWDRNGNGTWAPLAYDLHQSFGVYWCNGPGLTHGGLWATEDKRKSHPFHGGLHVPVNRDNGNRAYEAIYQTPKFRRLLVRRLRTLMDAILKEPGTSKTDTPFWRDYVMPMYAAMKSDAATDRKKYPINTTWNLYVWKQSLTFEEALDDLWDNYIVPRRNHFYVTHSITNAAYELGYAVHRNAGIPLAQRPIAALKAKFSAAAVPGGVVIRNLNDETVDLSGWKLSGPVDYTFPPGAVIDQAVDGAPGEVFVVTDRKAYVAANETTLTDQVILGNAKPGAGTAIALVDASGAPVISVR